MSLLDNLSREDLIAELQATKSHINDYKDLLKVSRSKINQAENQIKQMNTVSKDTFSEIENIDYEDDSFESNGSVKIPKDLSPTDLQKVLHLTGNKGVALEVALSIFKDYKSGNLKSKSAWKSSILQTAGVGALTIFGTRFGMTEFGFTPEQVMNFITGQSVFLLGAIAVLRKWFTTHLLRR